MRTAILLVLLINLVQAKQLVFTPLPIWSVAYNLQEYTPLTSYLERKLPLSFKYEHISDYAQIIKKFKKEEIDIAVLGPLPYTILKKEYKDATPIVSFKNAQGKISYRCALIKYKADKIDTKNLKIALTQPLSTCGYHNTKLMLEKNYGVDIEDVTFEYLGSHTKAAKAVLAKKYDLAGVKEDIAQRFLSVGFEIVDFSQEVPEFVLVANSANVDEKMIEALQNALLTIPQDVEKNLGHGFAKSDETLYQKLYEYEIKY